MAPSDLFGFRTDHAHQHPYLLGCLDAGSLIMLSMAAKRGRRVIRQMVRTRTVQGRGILRERQLRGMFTLDASPGALANNGRALSPFSSDAALARTRGLASIVHLISSHPVVRPKTITLAMSLLDRFLLKASKHASTSNPRVNRERERERVCQHRRIGSTHAPDEPGSHG